MQEGGIVVRLLDRGCKLVYVTLVDRLNDEVHTAAVRCLSINNCKGYHHHRKTGEELHEKLHPHLAAETLIIRKGRHEPRAQKRRPKSYQLLTQPRHPFKETRLSPCHSCLSHNYKELSLTTA